MATYPDTAHGVLSGSGSFPGHGGHGAGPNGTGPPGAVRGGGRLGRRRAGRAGVGRAHRRDPALGVLGRALVHAARGGWRPTRAPGRRRRGGGDRPRRRRRRRRAPPPGRRRANAFAYESARRAGRPVDRGVPAGGDIGIGVDDRARGGDGGDRHGHPGGACLGRRPAGRPCRGARPSESPSAWLRRRAVVRRGPRRRRERRSRRVPAPGARAHGRAGRRGDPEPRRPRGRGALEDDCPAPRSSCGETVAASARALFQRRVARSRTQTMTYSPRRSSTDPPPIRFHPPSRSTPRRAPLRRRAQREGPTCCGQPVPPPARVRASYAPAPPSTQAASALRSPMPYGVSCARGKRGAPDLDLRRSAICAHRQRRRRPRPPVPARQRRRRARVSQNGEHRAPPAASYTRRAGTAASRGRRERRAGGGTEALGRTSCATYLRIDEAATETPPFSTASSSASSRRPVPTTRRGGVSGRWFGRGRRRNDERRASVVAPLRAR